MADRTAYANPDLLVETEWLQAHLNDPNLRIIDCTGPEPYAKAHIPGSVAPREPFMKDPKDAKRVLIMGPEDYAKQLGELGVDENTTVITYDNLRSNNSCRFWWTLRYHGHMNVKVLNGGWQKWVAEGRPITFKPTKVAPTTFEPKVNPNLICTVDGLKERIGQAGVQIWDARSIEEYDGRNDRGNARKGHVPGANNAEWTQMMSNDDLQTFRPAAEMWEVIDRLGLSPDKEIVSYCQGGIRAAHANFVLTLLGFTNARNYDGSMREWANRDDTPLVLP